jgi:hypothetical protein
VTNTVTGVTQRSTGVHGADHRRIGDGFVHDPRTDAGPFASEPARPLVVDLNLVHLTVSGGQTGPGNLLGNLLCGLANALNGNGGSSPEAGRRERHPRLLAARVCDVAWPSPNAGCE